jgi:hypothetical protein
MLISIVGSVIRALIMRTVIAGINHDGSRTMYHHRTWAMYYHHWAGLYVHGTWAMYYHHWTRLYVHGTWAHIIVMRAVVRALIMIATTTNSNTPRNIACPQSGSSG